MLAEIHSPKLFLPESLYTTHPSHLHIDIMKRAQVKNVHVVAKIIYSTSNKNIS